ncbi:MAG TPA: rod shape-determining protein MreD [Kiritimatiellia bacterium]|nr:rod shape-determining protein MreD [Kiritimatiellia bacterium]HMO98104.1 rod shape-determining protein MreD [Kiritimatiellia bacterium]HMP96316.1 rod shape-determining protein MreD [Kiritimatiellia bacterium]
MTLVTMLFLLLTGTAIQSLAPVVSWLGYATAPVLGAVVVYYALYRGGVMMLVMALLAGLFQDSMSMTPLGYSSFGFAACALVIERYRDLMILHASFTHMIVTAALHGVVTLVLMVLLLKDGLIAWHPLWLPVKIPGAVLMGLVTGPLVIGAVHALEEKLGLIQGNTESHGAQRSYLGIG